MTNNMMTINKMRNIGGPGETVKDTKVWTNSNRIRERIDEEIKTRQAKIQEEGLKCAYDKDARAENANWGEQWKRRCVRMSRK